jgi:aspartate-semialdehyde dehydrogenase
MSSKIRVGILGATGTVGQRFIQLLENHPQFEITALAASDRSQGKTFAEACSWKLAGDMPEYVKSITVSACEPPLYCDVVFSSLPSDIARETEEAFANEGYPVISNSSAFRMDEDVPLLIPEVNPEHLKLLEVQKQNRRFKENGLIVTNPNCSTIVVVCALAPLHFRYGVEAVVVTTMQAISGAGYPGVPSLDITDNLFPFIKGEEEKIETETQKLLGKFSEDKIEFAPCLVSAQTNRVNIVDGHTAAIRFKLKSEPSIEEIKSTLASFTSLPQELNLRTAPQKPIIVREEQDRPQPRLDRDAGGGMATTVGRIMRDNVLGYRMIAMNHNTIRGAAGAAVLNAELMLAQGYLKI